MINQGATSLLLDDPLPSASLFFFLTGVSALEVGVDGIIGSTIAAGLMLVAIVIVSAILCYK